MVRNILLAAILLITMVIAVAFAALNPGLIMVDLAFSAFEVQKSLAFVTAFGAGMAFGMLCALLLLVRLLNDRRKLRRSLKLAESEVQSLRSIPQQDA